MGDNVEIDIIDEKEHTGNIIKLLPRNNELIRPAVANIDGALIVFASASPAPNYTLLSRFLVLMSKNDIETVICFNTLLSLLIVVSSNCSVLISPNPLNRDIVKAAPGC